MRPSVFAAIIATALQLGCAGAPAAPSVPATPFALTPDPNAIPYVLTLDEQRARKREYSAQHSFEQHDVNRDGYLDADEWVAREWAYQLAFDLNNDGAMTRDEFLVAGCPTPPPTIRDICAPFRMERFVDLDRRPRDNSLSGDEYRAATMARFRHNDRRQCRDGRMRPVHIAGQINRGERSCEDTPPW